MPLSYDNYEFESQKVLKVSGVLNEDVDLEPLKEPSIQLIDCEEVKQMFSVGIRKWVMTLKERSPDHPLKFLKCSVVFIEQLNLIEGFVETEAVVSFYAPYFCDKCDKVHEILLKPSEVEDAEAPEKNCPEHGSTMEFDDDEEEYFEFLQE